MQLTETNFVKETNMMIKKERKLLFPVDGKAVALNEVPDEAFSSGMLGIGFAVIPEAGTVYAPTSGEIINVAEVFSFETTSNSLNFAKPCLGHLYSLPL